MRAHLCERRVQGSEAPETGLEHNDLADLEITMQLDRSKPEPYAWEVQYMSRYSVDLDEAETMVKTLRLINKRMKAMSTKFGEPKTFAQYCLRVAEAVKAKGFVNKVSGNGSSYTENEWTWIDYDWAYRFEYQRKAKKKIQYFLNRKRFPGSMAKNSTDHCHGLKHQNLN